MVVVKAKCPVLLCMHVTVKMNISKITLYIYIYSAFQVVQQASINVNCYGRVKGDTRN